MRPEHFKAVLKSSSPVLAEKALVALIKLVNVMAAGKVPKAVAPFLCGARLHGGNNIARIANAVQVTTCLLVSTSVY